MNISYKTFIRSFLKFIFHIMVMSYVSLMVPFVLAYITYAWYSMDKVKITKEEIESKDSHNY